MNSASRQTREAILFFSSSSMKIICVGYSCFRRDQCGEFDVFPVFAANAYTAIIINIVGAGHREIRRRSRSHCRAVTALANIALHLKTAKSNGFVVLPVVPNAFKCTE